MTQKVIDIHPISQLMHRSMTKAERTRKTRKTQPDGERGKVRVIKEKRDETSHRCTCGGVCGVWRVSPALHHSCHRYTTPLSSRLSIHPSLAPSASVSLKNLSAKKSCQAYFLVIAPSSPVDLIPSLCCSRLNAPSSCRRVCVCV